MSERPVLLDDAEAAMLCHELKHAPSCVWSRGAPVSNTLQFPDCTCGYFTLLERAQAKIKASREDAA